MCPAASGFITTFPVFKDWTFLNCESKVNTPSLQLLLVRYLLRGTRKYRKLVPVRGTDAAKADHVLLRPLNLVCASPGMQ